jgi:hypothetical protein
MLIYSMSVSVDGFIADREGAFGWTTPTAMSRTDTAVVLSADGVCHLCSPVLEERVLRFASPGRRFGDEWRCVRGVGLDRLAGRG